MILSELQRRLIPVLALLDDIYLICTGLYVKIIQYALFSCFRRLWSRANSVKAQERLLDCILLCITLFYTDHHTTNTLKEDNDIDEEKKIERTREEGEEEEEKGEQKNEHEPSQKRDSHCNKIKNLFMQIRMERVMANSNDDGTIGNIPSKQAIWEIVRALNIESVSDEISLLLNKRSYRLLLIFCVQTAMKTAAITKDDDEYIHLKAYAHSINYMSEK